MQSLAPLDAEIVVIDNASEDDTATVLRAWAAKSPFPVNLQFEARKDASYAQNCGLRAARGSLYQPPYAVTDCAHSRVQIEWMRSGVAMSLFQALQQASTISS